MGTELRIDGFAFSVLDRVPLSSATSKCICGVRMRPRFATVGDLGIAEGGVSIWVVGKLR